MRIRHSTANAGEYCERCAYPFDAGEGAYIVNGDAARPYCSTNCATKDTCERSLKALRCRCGAKATHEMEGYPVCRTCYAGDAPTSHEGDGDFLGSDNHMTHPSGEMRLGR